NRSILECSGISSSLNFKDHYWVHNDSGGKGAAFLITSKGKSRLEVKLNQVQNRDFEDCATFRQNGKSYVAIGDIGDNLRQRNELVVYIFEEPAVLPDQESISLNLTTTITFKFEDKIKRDCEGLAYFSPTQTLLVGSKLKTRQILNEEKAGIFQLQFDISKKKQRSIAKQSAEVPGGMNTGMDFRLDGQYAVIRNYLHGTLFRISNSDLKQSFTNNLGQRIDLPFQRQGEAICFTKDGKNLIVTSEGKNQAIYEIRLR
ncbi:MAG: hypothetical protein VX438_03465, partial [Planctomycetota bacterium]|nr:hypothetical protein [Planctomycetota bacterium]